MTGRKRRDHPGLLRREATDPRPHRGQDTPQKTFRSFGEGGRTSYPWVWGVLRTPTAGTCWRESAIRNGWQGTPADPQNPTSGGGRGTGRGSTKFGRTRHKNVLCPRINRTPGTPDPRRGEAMRAILRAAKDRNGQVPMRAENGPDSHATARDMGIPRGAFAEVPPPWPGTPGGHGRTGEATAIYARAGSFAQGIFSPSRLAGTASKRRHETVLDCECCLLIVMV